MASSSSCSNARGKKYEVFISFRGAEVRNNFLSHLLDALARKQIKAFVDDTDLEKGKPIAPTLLKTIEESYISIVIFSKDYPKSEWCLDELHKILQCMEKNNQIAVHVFYDVDPSVVQDLQQNYALSIHAGKVQDLKLENWSNALREISNLSGFNSADPKHKPEAKLCDEIANDVSKKLSGLSASYSLNYGLFDIDSRIEHVESLIKIEENSVSMIGIWGMGGIGKTTLADKVFNRIKYNFGSYCFVSDVRGKLSNGLATTYDLRNEIIQKLLGDESIKLDSPNMIDEFIWRRLKDKKVLIVLDDVDDHMHLKSILEDSGLCCPGMFCAESRIIVTGRNRQVFEIVPMKKHINQVKELNNNQALQLFSWRVFGQSFPQEEYKELSEKAVKYAQGLPLALVVLSADLKGKSKKIWVDKLKKIEDIPPGNIIGILRTSFDGLDRDEKRIFLDIACFLKGRAVKYVERILQSFDFYSIDGMERLCDKSLTTVKVCIHDEFGTIEMHDLLQQMGQEIVVKESEEKIEKQSRLWKWKDIRYVLRTDRGTENVEGISLNMGELDGHLNISSKAFINMHKLRFLRVFDYFYYVNLDRNKVYLPDGLEFLPNSLRYLRWNYFPLSFLPFNFSLDELVELEMPDSNLKELVWDKPPPNLKRISLSYSSDLIKISNLGEALNLEIIELCECKSLVNIGSSLEKLDSLIKLDLRGCTSLYKFPEVPCNTKELILTDNDELDVPELHFCELSILGSKFKNLDVSYCKNLNRLPKDLGNLEFLQTIDASRSSLKGLPSAICNLRSLKYLDIYDFRDLNKLADNLGNLDSLKEFNASGIGLEELSFSISKLRSKIRRIVQHENSSKLLDDLGNLTHLEKLALSMNSMEELSFSICNLKFLKELYIFNCKNLNKLPVDLEKLESLEILVVSGSGLQNLPSSLCNLRSLKILNLSKCGNLSKLPKNLGNLESLRELNVSGTGLKELPDIPQNLKRLLAANCESLKSVPTSFKFPLDLLDLSNCKKLYEGASSTIQQRLQESQYLSIYKCDLCIVGSEVPQWMKYRNSSSSSLFFEFDTRGHSIWFIFCAVIVAVDHRSYLCLKACLTDECGNKKEYYSPGRHSVVIKRNLEHVILWHGQIDHSVRGVSFEIYGHCDWLKIKSIGVHPIVERADDREKT